ncbi:MAG: hypothetical protein EPO28_17380 [Saprospiraceae bacterium]|nr:MAG: hypothetical protein EPO28_17380 [Saprospiraceae bacterium]
MNSPEQKERILRELPPRHLSWYTRAVLFFGDQVSQTGWLLFAAGSLFFWNTSTHSEARLWFHHQTLDWSSIAGVILSEDSTGKWEDKKQIWQYGHYFALDGVRYTGKSYSIGKKFDAGQIAYIQYDPEDPGYNCIIGMRQNLYPVRANWLLLLPLLGLLFIFYPVSQNLRFIRLLKIGDFTRGKMVGKTATNQTVKTGGSVRPVMRYLFAFEYEGTIYHAHCHTHRTNLVEDEETESILFDRYNPAFNLVYDAVPNVPATGTNGKMMPAPAGKAWVLFLPAFGIAVNLVYLLLS